MNSFIDNEAWWNIYAQANWVITGSCMVWWQPGTTLVYYIWQILFKDTYTLQSSLRNDIAGTVSLAPIRIDIWYHSVQNYVSYLLIISMLKEMVCSKEYVIFFFFFLPYGDLLPLYLSVSCEIYYPFSWVISLAWALWQSRLFQCHGSNPPNYR